MKITVSTHSGHEYVVSGDVNSNDTKGTFFVVKDQDDDIVLAVAVGCIEAVVYDYDYAS